MGSSGSARAEGGNVLIYSEFCITHVVYGDKQDVCTMKDLTPDFLRYSAWPFSDWKFSRNENGFVGSGGRDLNVFPRAMPVSIVCCFSSGGVSGKAVLSFFLRATPG